MQFGGRRSETVIEIETREGTKGRVRKTVSEGQVNIDRVVSGLVALGVLEVVTTVVLALVN